MHYRLARLAMLTVLVAGANRASAGDGGAAPIGPPVPDREQLRQLWDMTALRALPFELEKLSTRRVPAATGAPATAGGQSLIVEEFYYSSESTPDGANRIYCAIARPEGVPGRVPVIMIFHGGGGHASPSLALAAARNHPGMAGFAMDYNGQFIASTANVTKWKNITSERRLNLSPDLRNHAMYHRVVAARRGIDFLETQAWADTSRLGCFGVSAGGWIALVLAGVDDRVRAVTTAVSAGGAEGTASRSAQSLRLEPAEQRPLWLAAYEPLAYAAETRAAVFFQLSTNDIFFWLSGAERNLAALGGKKGWMLCPNSNHNVGGPAMPDTSPPAWMKSVLTGAPALAEIRDLRHDPDGATYSWTVESPDPVARAVLTWSPGRSISPARYWVEFPAERTGDRWSARIPDAYSALASDVFATVFDTRRGAVSSAILHRDGLDPRVDPTPLWKDNAFWDVSRGTAAWRSTVGALASTRFEVDAQGRLHVAPARDAREFVVLSNSVVLASGTAARHRGIRVRVDGNGQSGTLDVSLTRDGGSLDEVAYRAAIHYAPSTNTFELPWSEFHARNGGESPVWPFDGLQLGGQRDNGRELIVEAIELLP